MYKVFINEASLEWINRTPKNSETCISISDSDVLKKELSILAQEKAVQKFVYSDDIEGSWSSFCSNFKIIDAAGGVVKNDENEILMIYRLGKWDLPKGKLEKGESIEICAIREVEEECGIDGLVLGKALPTMYHTYTLGDKDILKRTYWFEMTTNSTKALIPQEEEGIEKVEWVGKEKLKEYMDNTYASIAWLLEHI